ncbi:hypothetical protein PAAG_11244 [Paracoccidioides lutzii Pb01]|uniref:Uncharacterized protein n=1 Tax=Paracoccidioides lutzii (strain ATCC MYA-826 / Pb01) TaxID=502779 RepID=A0A0A2V3K4_PARBA|nr:hypothetical protein PAAG_11244 [Paracoccidioides lutzii Pb01]KGQ02063.1 hypothetical protein PAAG_11244 [Paracoccidioides lutzii Pb01]
MMHSLQPPTHHLSPRPNNFPPNNLVPHPVHTPNPKHSCHIRQSRPLGLNCWSLTLGSIASDEPGRRAWQTSLWDLMGNANTPHSVICLQGLAHKSKEEAWVKGERNGLFIAADTADVAVGGHPSRERERMLLVQAPFCDGVLLGMRCYIRGYVRGTRCGRVAYIGTGT